MTSQGREVHSGHPMARPRNRPVTDEGTPADLNRREGSPKLRVGEIAERAGVCAGTVHGRERLP